jgi:hypothetical protein
VVILVPIQQVMGATELRQPFLEYLQLTLVAVVVEPLLEVLLEVEVLAAVATGH